MAEVDNITVSNEADPIHGDSSHSKAKAHAFNTKTCQTDLALIVEEDTLYVSKHVLASVSPVVNAMFNGEFKEKSTDELPLPEKKSADVLEFLQCIYPNMLTPVTLENVYAVLPLADEYQVAMLEAACESCLLGLLSKDISADNLYEILTKAKMFNLPRVAEKGINIAADRPLTEIENAVNTVKVSEDIYGEIRVRMLQKIGTSTALCMFLGAAAQQKHLVSQYIQGHVVGDWGSLRISSPYNETSLNLNIGDISLTAYLSRGISYRHSLEVFIQCNHQVQYTLNCVCAVVVNNWMKNKDDIFEQGNIQFGSSETGKKLFTEINIRTIETKTAGFIYEGIINIDLFLFSIPEIS